MGLFLGIDTSNYTTSAALFDSGAGTVRMEKKLLPTAEGAAGLRQSDAVFAHVKQLGQLVGTLFNGENLHLDGVGVSLFPRREEGSYMPCFLVGEMGADLLCGAMGLSKYGFSHQEGHVAAALYSAGQLQMMEKPFLAFHVSGGTTDALLATPGSPVFSIAPVGRSLDLKAGQAIDRVGLALGLKFPCGPALTALAEECDEKIRIKAPVKGSDCSLSGVENQCCKLLQEGREPAYIARYCIAFIQSALEQMTDALLKEYGPLPLLYAGGVMSCRIIRTAFEARYGGVFADPAYSSDNAAGVAVLASLSAERGR